MIQYQNLRTNIIRIVGYSVMRITNEILEVKGVRPITKYQIIAIDPEFSKKEPVDRLEIDWGTLSDWECNRTFPVKNKGNGSYKELIKAI